MRIVSIEEFKNFLKNQEYVCTSRDIYLLDKRNLKIETILEFNDNTITAIHRDNFYDELEDNFDKRIYYNLGNVVVDESLMCGRFEKLLESNFVKFEVKSPKEILQHEELLKHIRTNVKFDLVSKNITRKEYGYIFGLRRYFIETPHIIKMIYLEKLPTVNDFRKLVKISRIPILDNQKFQDDRYVEEILDCLKETIDLDINDLAKGVDLSINSDSSLTHLEKLGIFGLSLPGINLFLERNIILPS